jgi:hypothetical protein
MAKHFLKIGSRHLRTIAFVIAFGLIAAAPPPTETHRGGPAVAQPSASLTIR